MATVLAASDDRPASGIMVGLCEAVQQANVSLVPAAQLAPQMLSGLLAAVARLELEFSQTAPLAGGNTRIGHWLIRRQSSLQIQTLT